MLGKHRDRKNHGFFLNFLFFLMVIPLWAYPLTPSCDVKCYEDENYSTIAPNAMICEIANFKIGGNYLIETSMNSDSAPNPYLCGGQDGITLESLSQKPHQTTAPLMLHYQTAGRCDEPISNAVLIGPPLFAESNILYNFWYGREEHRLIGDGELIDTKQNCVIFVSTLGGPFSSRPSDGLGQAFPEYTIFDIVQTKYLILQKLNVASLKLVTGPSLGGIEAYAMAILHPNYVQGIMPMGAAVHLKSSSTDEEGTSYRVPLIIDVLKDYVRSGSEPQSGFYSYPQSPKTIGCTDFPPVDKPLSERLKEDALSMFLIGLPCEIARNYKADADGKESYFEMAGIKDKVFQGITQHFSINDFFYRMNMMSHINVTPYFEKISAQSLILHVENDPMFSIRQAVWAQKTLAEQNKNSKLCSIFNKRGHAEVIITDQLLTKCETQIKTFFKDIALLSEPLTLLVANQQDLSSITNSTKSDFTKTEKKAPLGSLSIAIWGFFGALAILYLPQLTWFKKPLHKFTKRMKK